MRFVGACVVLFGFAACDSNPTPHPQDDSIVGAYEDTFTPAEPEGPDDNDNGIPDCVEANGFWDGEACKDRDPSLVPDGTGGAGDAVTDGGDGEVIDPDALEVIDDATAPDADANHD